MATEKAKFTCGVCDYTKEEVSPWRFGDDTVCWQCREEDYVPLFEEALKFDAQYPVKWQNEPIDVAFVAPFLGEEFVKNYRLKDQRANTIGRDRRFCRHQTPDDKPFYELGVPALPPNSDVPPTECDWLFDPDDTAFSAGGKSQAVRCARCAGLSCNKCGIPMCETGDEMGVLHKHIESDECAGRWPTAGDYTEGLEGLKRGRDYQICRNPDCCARIELAAACNHITCRQCSASFCYICGQEAEHNSDHWSAGSSCPRFNQPDEDNAQFDDLRPNRFLTEQQLLDPNLRNRILIWVNVVFVRDLHRYVIEFHISKAIELLTQFLESLHEPIPDWCTKYAAAPGRITHEYLWDDEHIQAVEVGNFDSPDELLENGDRNAALDHWGELGLADFRKFRDFITFVVNTAAPRIVDGPPEALNDEDSRGEKELLIEGCNIVHALPALLSVDDVLDPPGAIVESRETGYCYVILSWKRFHAYLVAAASRVVREELMWLPPLLSWRGRVVIHVDLTKEKQQIDHVRLEHELESGLQAIQKLFQDVTWDLLHSDERLMNELLMIALHTRGKEYNAFGPDLDKYLRESNQTDRDLYEKMLTSGLPSVQINRLPARWTDLSELNEKIVMMKVPFSYAPHALFDVWKAWENNEQDDDDDRFYAFPNWPRPGELVVYVERLENGNIRSSMDYRGLREAHREWMREMKEGPLQMRLWSKVFVHAVLERIEPRHGVRNQLSEPLKQPSIVRVDSDGLFRMSMHLETYQHICIEWAIEMEDANEEEWPTPIPRWGNRTLCAGITIEYRKDEHGEVVEVTRFEVTDSVFGRWNSLTEYFAGDPSMPFYSDFDRDGRELENIVRFVDHP